MSFWKQKMVGYLFFLAVFALFVPKVNTVWAVACGGDCSIYACDAGLSCVASVCRTTSPTAASRYPQSPTTNSTSGTFYVYASGVSNATSVTFPTWSSINGQDDIVWYPGTNLGGGLWRAAVNLATHSVGAQVINVHVYLNNCTYTNLYSGTANFSICPARVECPAATCGTAPSNELDGTCGTHYCPGNPDNSPPAVPVGTVSYTPDPTCKDIYTATYSWNAVSDVGCYGLNSTPYWAQGSSNAAYSSVLYGWNNAWVASTPRSQTSVSSYAPGTTLYFHVRSRDAGNNQSAWSTTNTVVVPSPTLYPTISVSGPLSEDINRTCYPMSLLSNLTLEPVVVPALGVTPVCTMPTTSSYLCNFTIDNQKANCVSQNITVTMNATYSGYGTVGWRTGSGGGECTGDPTSRSYTIGNSETNIPIFLAYNTVIPTAVPTTTPVPTVTPGGPTITPSPIPTTAPTPAYAVGWFKLNGASFNSRMSNRQNYVPRTLQKYDATTDDSITNHHIMIGSSGILLQNGPLDPGSNAYESGVKTYSTNNWYTNGYASTNTISVAKYIDYIKGRKNFTSITGAVTASSFLTSGVYVYVGDLTLDPTWFDGKNIVLVVQGTVSISSATFIPTNGSLALLSNIISIDSSVTEIKAILIGTQVLTGNSDVNPLKITGNLIDEEESGMLLGRTRADGTKPSLFIVFNPQMYLNVLPYLSTSTYDWRQTQ